jgi:hypothetical protein
MSSTSTTPLADRLRDRYEDLVSRLISTYYTDFLFGKRVFSAQDKEKLEQMEKQPIAQAKYFIDTLLNKGETAINTFLEYLRKKSDGQPHLYTLLFPPEESLPLQRCSPDKEFEPVSEEGSPMSESSSMPCLHVCVCVWCVPQIPHRIESWYETVVCDKAHNKIHGLGLQSITCVFF